MSTRIPIILLVVFCVAAGGSIAGDWTLQKTQRGEAEMVLDGGKTGNVPFNHHIHQERLSSACEACHDLFPQRKGVILELQNAGKLGKKDVMKQCQKCHRKAKKEGKPSGPIGCKDCHSIKG